MIWAARYIGGFLGGVAFSLARSANDHAWTIGYALSAGLLFAISVWAFGKSR